MPEAMNEEQQLRSCCINEVCASTKLPKLGLIEAWISSAESTSTTSETSYASLVRGNPPKERLRFACERFWDFDEGGEFIRRLGYICSSELLSRVSTCSVGVGSASMHAQRLLRLQDSLKATVLPNAAAFSEIPEKIPTEHTQQRNRRYRKLKQLLAGGSYFSESSICMRHPDLHSAIFKAGAERFKDFSPRLMLGQALIEASEIISSNGSLSSPSPLPNVQTNATHSDNAINVRTSERNGCAEEEEREDRAGSLMHYQHQQLRLAPEVVATTDRHGKLDELIRLASERFLDGWDHLHIDYRKIDTDDILDDLDQIQRDAEDAYFG